jgi:MFS family permease
MQRSDSRAEAAGAKTEEDTISPGYANYVLGLLLAVNVINYIDRQVLSIFIGPIKAEFGVSDTSMGFLVGFAFALFYTVAGIPIARWADRGTRRNIIALGLALWSAMTVASGLARSFLQLALARVWVGVGEAAATPPSRSIDARRRSASTPRASTSARRWPISSVATCAPTSIGARLSSSWAHPDSSSPS